MENENMKLNEQSLRAFEALIMQSKEVQYFLQGVINAMEIKGSVIPRIMALEFIKKETKAGQ